MKADTVLIVIIAGTVEVWQVQQLRMRRPVTRFNSKTRKVFVPVGHPEKLGKAIAKLTWMARPIVRKGAQRP